MAFFGKGGTEEQMKAPINGEYAYRPVYTLPEKDKKLTETSGTKEQLTGNGSDYRGKQNKTKGGYTCQNWNSDATHKRHTNAKKAYREKRDLEHALFDFT